MMSAAQKQQMLCVMTGLQTEAVTVNHWQSQISALGPVLFIYGGVYVGTFFTTKVIGAL